MVVVIGKITTLSISTWECGDLPALFRCASEMYQAGAKAC